MRNFNGNYSVGRGVIRNKTVSPKTAVIVRPPTTAEMIARMARPVAPKTPDISTQNLRKHLIATGVISNVAKPSAFGNPNDSTDPVACLPTTA